MTSKSKAVTAAERASGGAREKSAPVEGRWTKSMVGRAVLAFHDIDRVPPYDDEGIRKLVRDFLRFVHRVEGGGIEDDAMPLARTFVARGYQWLAEHPQYAPLSTKPWTLDMVEQLILWFNDTTAASLDRRRLFEVAERLHTFERVVKSGAIERGEAETLAEAFLDYAERWLHGEPEAQAHYESL